ncbi:MAG: helix-turn-helix transcriptional regulator [Rheinheimera sp.]|nr:helix-turn-helix transcriptional regulator [Rheinheimera sp.]
MLHQSLQFSLFIVSVLLLCAQLWVRHKSAVHLWFALFCGSIAIMALQRLGGADWGIWQYLIGLGACLTCNGYWLVARALFRPGVAVDRRHISVAAVVAVLVIGHQLLQLLQSQWQPTAAVWAPANTATAELLTLLSSTMLMLTLWEGCRGLTQLSGAERAQRLLFLVSFTSALLLCLILAKTWPTAAGNPAMQQNLAALAAMWILGVTQGLIWWRFPASSAALQVPAEHEPEVAVPAALCAADQQLLDAIHIALEQEKLFLQTSLKVADLARRFAVPEYRVSRVLRQQYPQWNFNQLINALRIQHAQQLLADPAKQHWSVLVVGLESGFGSAGPFSRAFKALTGLTPNEYRQQSNGRTMPAG